MVNQKIIDLIEATFRLLFLSEKLLLNEEVIEFSKKSTEYYTNMWGTNRKFCTYNLNGDSKYTWNALKLGNSWFLKNIGDDDSNSLRSIDFNADTGIPCNVQDS